MTPERWARTEALFHQACALPPPGRAAFLALACADDEAMRRNVETLLDESASDDAFLAGPAPGLSASPVGDPVVPTMTGRSLGVYHLQELLGAGGMGEVYRALDTKLGRDVAIKILPGEFTRHPERLARFEREARMLAALNHPGICAIYGFEEADGIRFLVLELVEGKTLADALARASNGDAAGVGLPLAQVLRIARQVAEALDTAHDKGIVHRDLKPANIKVTPDGVVKVLDFGLAKAVAGEGSSPTLTHVPETAAAAPRPGPVLGTAAYMSPEQARGLAVDRRTDIWAFGCVLYEMLTGSAVFAGATASDSIARILEREPDWAALPSATPPAIRRLLARCLEKDPRERLRDIADARIDLTDTSLSPAAERSGAGAARSRRPSPRIIPWTVAGLLGGSVVALASALVWLAPWRVPLPPPVVHLEVGLGADASLVTTGGAAAVLSPDGQTLAFAARTSDGVQQLYVRRLDELQATALSGTDGAFDPFFSPEGRWIAFFADGRLKKVAVAGGAVVALADAPQSGGGTWAADGTIVFSPGFLGPLVQVSSDGGAPDELTTLAEGELTQRWPQVLPGAGAVLYTASSNPTSAANASLVVQSWPNGSYKILLRGATYGRYVPREGGVRGSGPAGTGHLVYVQGGTLFAAPFDPVRLEVTGAAIPVIEGVTADNSGGGAGTAGGSRVGGAQFALSDTGTLVYQPGRNVGAVRAPIVWMDRSGRTKPLHEALADWSHPRFSPDGGRLAIDITDQAGNTDVWVYDLSRSDLARMTTDAGADVEPTWTPDGQRLVFQSTRENATTNLYWQRADGSGAVQRLTESGNHQYGGSSWHPDGKILAFTEVAADTGFDLMLLPIEGTAPRDWTPATPTALVRTPADELQPMFSPDGKWLAYLSNESGRFEVYVQPFPGPGGRSKASNGGAHYYSKISWSPTRTELLFGSPDQRIMVVPYAVEGGAFRADTPRPWSNRAFLSLPRGGTFDLHPDGARLAMGAALDTPVAATPDHVVFVFNFGDQLDRLSFTR